MAVVASCSGDNCFFFYEVGEIEKLRNFDLQVSARKKN